MNEAEYILRLILRARDELSTKLAKIRTELQGLEKDSGKATKEFDELNKRITSANNRIGSLTDKVKEARAAFRDLVGEEGKAKKSHENLASSVDKATGSVEDHVKAIEDLNNKLGALRQAHQRTDEEVRKGNITRDQAAKSYQRISQELDKLSKQAPVASRQFFDITDLANQARESQKVIRDAFSAEDKIRSDNIKKMEADRDAAAARNERVVERNLNREIAAEKSAAAERVQARKDAEDDVLGLIEEELQKARQARATNAALETAELREQADRRKGILDAEHHDEQEAERTHQARLKQERTQAENELFDLIANLNNRQVQGRRVDQQLELSDIREQAERIKTLREAEQADELESERRHQSRLKNERASAEQEVFDLIASLSQQQQRGGKVSGAIDTGDMAEAAQRMRVLREAEEEEEAVAQRAAEERDAAHKREQDNLQRNIDKHNELWDKIDNTRNAYDRLNKEIGNSTDLSREQRVELGRIGQDFQRFSNAFETGTHEMRVFGTEADRIRERLRATNDETDNSGNAITRFGQRLQGVSNGINSFGTNIAAFDNQIRGMALLAAAGFAQQLLTVIVGLGGALVNVGSSAAMAGAAIGGALAAGVAQALPVLGILVAALARVKAVMDAVQQSQLVQQQRFQRKAKADQEDASQANTIANAQDSLRDAIDGVADARRRVSDAIRNVGDAQRRELDSVDKLRKARREGKRELEDLILAEKRAELQAKGASLSQAESQAAFAEAIRSGQSFQQFQRGELDVASSALDLTEATRARSRQRVDTRRAVAGGVEGLDTVRQARQGVEDAKRGVADAVRAVADAERGVTRAERSVARAQRGLENARATAAKAQSDSFAGAEKLNFMLSQLSGAERDLFDQFNILVDRWRKVSGVFTEPLIRELTRATKRINQMLLDPELVGAARDLAQEMADQFGRVFDELTKPSQIRQFLRIVDMARENLAPITDIIINLGHAFTNVAEAAGPSLRRLIGWFGDLSEDILKISESDGLKDFFDKATDNAIAWLNLGKEVVLLFAAIVSGGAADEGLGTVEDLTKMVHGATESIKSNGEGVRKFFHDSRGILNEVIRVLIALGKEVLKTFNPETVHSFADLLIKVIIPSFGNAIRIVGRLAEAFAKLADVPLLGDLLKIAIQFAIINRIIGGFLGLGGGLVGAIAKLTIGFGKLAGVLARIAGVVPGLGRLAPILARIAGSGATAAAVAGGGAAVADTFLGGGGAAAGGAARRGILSRAGRALGRGGLLTTAAVIGGQIVGSQVGGVGGSTISGAATGAGIGATVGSIVPVLGTGVGAAVGGAIGGGIGFFSGRAKQAEQEKRKSVQDLGKELDNLVRKRDLSGIDHLESKAKQLADEARRFGDKDLAEKYDNIANTAKKARVQVEILANVQRAMGDNKVAAKDIIDPQAVAEFGDNITRMKTMSFTGIGEIRSNMKFNVDKINEGLTQGSKSWADAMTTNFGAGITAVKNSMADGTVSVSDGVKEMHRITTQQLQFMRDNMDTLSRDGRDKLAKNFRSARIAIETQSGGWENATKDSLREIRRLMSAEFEAYGLDPEQAMRLARNRTTRGRQDVNQFGQNEGSNPSGGNATGGWLGKMGQRGWDSMRHAVGGAAAAAGEAVLNFAHIPVVNDALQGQYGFNLDQMFERTRAYHRGGPGQRGFAAGGVNWGGHPALQGGIARVVETIMKKYPQLSVTSTTDHGLRSSTGGISWHSKGKGADLAAPMTAAGKTLMHNAAVWISRAMPWLNEGIHNTGLSIKDGKKVDPGFWGVAWPQHINHIHVALAGAFGKVGDAIAAGAGGAAATIKRVLVKGPVSPFKAIAQAATDAVRRASITRMNDVIQTLGGDNGETDISGIAVTGKGAKANRELGKRMLGQHPLHSRPGSFSDLDYVWSHESGWDELVHYGGGHGYIPGKAYGIPQSLPGDKMASKGADWKTNPKTQIAWGLDYILDRYKSLAGVAAHWRANKTYAQGGMVPAILHAGEHVWTAAEVARAGGHNAVRAMRRMFGGGGQSDGNSFADGGAVGLGTAPDQATADAISAAQIVTTRSEQQRLRAIMMGVFAMTTRIVNDWTDLAKQFQQLGSAIHNTATSTKEVTRRIKNLSDRISDLRKGSVTSQEKDEYDAAIAERKRLIGIRDIRRGGVTRKERARLTALEAPDRSRFVQDIDQFIGTEQTPGLFQKAVDLNTTLTQKAARATAFATFGISGASQALAPGQNVTRVLSDTQITQRNLDAARAEQGRLAGIESQTGARIGQVQGRLAALRRGGIKPGEAREYAALQGQLVQLQNSFAQIRDANAAALQNIYDAQQAYQQAIKDAAQKVVDDINEGARRQLVDAENTGRVAAITGDRGLAQAATANKRAVIAGQISQLEGASVAIYNAFGANSNEYRAIVEQVADLRLQIAESLRQDLLNRIQDVEDAAGRSNASLARSGRVADVIARFGFGGVGAANPLAAAQQRVSIAQAQGGVLQNERNSLVQLMQVAAAQGNWDVYRDLGDKVAELDTSIVENTAAQREAATALRQVSIDLIQQRAQFRTGISGGLQGIIDTVGQITGMPNTGETRSLLQMQTGTLTTAGTGLRQQLLSDFGIDLRGLSGTSFVDAVKKLDFDKIESTMSEPDKKQFEDLINAIIENEGATQQNTLQLKQLNDPTNVASFSSSAWRMFRAAIFTGTGGVLPGFSNIPSFQSGGVMPHDGIARLHAGEKIIPVGSDGGSIYNTYITSPTEVADPDYFASRLDWNLRGRGKR